MRSPHPARLLAALVTSVVVLAGCAGGDDADQDAADGDTTSAEPSAADTAAAPSGDPAAEDADAGADGSDGQGAGDAAAGEAFPVTIEHAFGSTTVPQRPERVVSVGFGEHDTLLALEVTPVAVRDWYGDQPSATWPWAQDELADATPEVISAEELDVELVATLEPDLILGIDAGLTEDTYGLLSEVAPTIAHSGDHPPYGTPLELQTEMTAAAVGQVEAGATILRDIEEMFATVRDEHPSFTGATAAVAFVFGGEPGAYASADVRAEVLERMGFDTPPRFDELAGDQFYFTTSREDLTPLDQDVLVWLTSSDDEVASIRDLELRPSLTAVEEGREVVADFLLSGAFSHGSPLSIEYVVDELVPELAVAVDGDPSTAVPSADVLDEGPQ